MTDNIKSMIAGLGENEFILPVGYVDEEGVLHRKVTLTPMTGETEESIADPKVRDNGGKLITELLFSVIVKLGTLPRITRDIIRNLSVVDRDFLMVKNFQVSIGDILEYDDICSHCRGKNSVRVDLTTLDVSYLDDSEANREITFQLANGVMDKGILHKDITITLPTGIAQERVSQLARSNPALATTAMLQFITKSIGAIEFLSPDVFKKMTKKDRDLISTKLSEIEAGVKLSAEVLCSECGAEFTTMFPISALLGE